MTDVFKLMQKEEMNSFKAERQSRVRTSVESQVKTFEFIGDLIDIFLPKMADTLMVMAGSDPPDHEPFNTMSVEPHSKNTASGPSPDSEIIR